MSPTLLFRRFEQKKKKKNVLRFWTSSGPAAGNVLVGTGHAHERHGGAFICVTAPFVALHGGARIRRRRGAARSSQVSGLQCYARRKGARESEHASFARMEGGAGCGRSSARWFLTLPAPVVASSLVLWLQAVYGIVSPSTRRPAAPRLSRFSQLVRVTADCWCACMPGGSASADTARAGS